MFNDQYGLTQAVLDGRKTMTRRVYKYDRPNEAYEIVFPIFESKDYDEGNIISPLFGAFGWKNKENKFTGWNITKYKVGEVIAIAQSYKVLGYDSDALNRDSNLEIHGFMKDSAGWTNKMFVRADACKRHIENYNITIERLQDISDEDCLKEGIY